MLGIYRRFGLAGITRVRTASGAASLIVAASNASRASAGRSRWGCAAAAAATSATATAVFRLIRSATVMSLCYPSVTRQPASPCFQDAARTSSSGGIEAVCGGSVGGGNLQDRSSRRELRTTGTELGVPFDGDVDRAVRRLAYIADAYVERHEQRLAPFGLRRRLIERHALHLLSAQRANEEVPLPLRKAIPGVDQDARGADRRHPEHHGHLHAWAPPRLIRHVIRVIDLSERDQWPPVVAARDQPIQLVTAHRADLGGPHLARVRMPREPLQVAVAIGIDLRLRASLADERIIRGRGAALGEPQHLTGVVVELLGLDPIAIVIAAVPAVADADRQVQHAVGAELRARG